MSFNKSHKNKNSVPVRDLNIDDISIRSSQDSIKPEVRQNIHDENNIDDAQSDVASSLCDFIPREV